MPHADQRVAQHRRVARRNHDTVSAIDQVLRPAARGHENRAAAGQRLDNGDAKGLDIAGQHKGIGGGQFVAHLLRRQYPRKLHLTGDALRRAQSLELTPHRPVADQPQPHRGLIGERRGKGLDELRMSFLGRQPRDADEDKGRGRIALPRVGILHECRAERVGQVFPTRAQILLRQQHRQLWADRHAMLRARDDAPHEIALPPAQPALREGGAVLG